MSRRDVDGAASLHEPRKSTKGLEQPPRPVALRLLSGPVVGAELSGGDAHLASHVLDGVVGQLGPALREPSLSGQVLQEEGEGQPGGARLVAQQLELVADQSEVLHELVELQGCGYDPFRGPS